MGSGDRACADPGLAGGLDGVNSDPDAELLDPEDDTIGGEWDEMAGWDLDGEEEDDDC